MWIAEELAHDEPAARLDHARELAKRLLLIRNLSEHGDEVGGIEAAVGVGQFARVALGRGEVRDAALSCAPLGVVQHLLLQVEDLDRAAGL
jgi:hypothetical protein